MPLKVAIVGPPLAVLFGGQEIQAAALFTHWHDDKEVTATFLSSRPAFPEALTALNRISYFRTLVRLPLYIASLLRVVGDVEVVHVFAGSFGTFWIATAPALLVARLRRRRILVHYHSGRADEHLRISTFARQIIRTCDMVVVPSEYLATSFRAYGVSPVVVANVVDPGRYSYRPRNPLQPKLLCTRNLETHYGVDIVVRAFARVQQQFPEASLTLVGTGQRLPEVRRLVENLALQNVHFRGAVHPDSMPSIYDQSDIFVNGSYIDCAPVSILEAFCSGLPVATTGAGGIPYLVEHERTGLLSPPGNWVALADNIIGLLRNSDIARSMAETAQQRADLHSWRSLRPQWLTVYRAARDGTGSF